MRVPPLRLFVASLEATMKLTSEGLIVASPFEATLLSLSLQAVKVADSAVSAAIKNTFLFLIFY